MGGATFQVTAIGKTAREAFEKAREEALYESGHGGYTGTIAEKPSFVEMPLPEGLTPRMAMDLIEEGPIDPSDHPDLDRKHLTWAVAASKVYDSKWGPALAFKTKADTWCFCGWASD